MYFNNQNYTLLAQIYVGKFVIFLYTKDICNFAD